MWELMIGPGARGGAATRRDCVTRPSQQVGAFWWWCTDASSHFISTDQTHLNPTILEWLCCVKSSILKQILDFRFFPISTFWFCFSSICSTYRQSEVVFNAALSNGLGFCIFWFPLLLLPLPGVTCHLFRNFINISLFINISFFINISLWWQWHVIFRETSLTSHAAESDISSFWKLHANVLFKACFSIKV